jgi:hypothetical protein
MLDCLIGFLPPGPLAAGRRSVAGGLADIGKMPPDFPEDHENWAALPRPTNRRGRRCAPWRAPSSGHSTGPWRLPAWDSRTSNLVRSPLAAHGFASRRLIYAGSGLRRPAWRRGSGACPPTQEPMGLGRVLRLARNLRFGSTSPRPHLRACVLCHPDGSGRLNLAHSGAHPMAPWA